MQAEYTTWSLLAPLLWGAVTTIQVTAGALVVAVALGLLTASIVYFFPYRPVKAIVGVYVEFFRNIPTITHLFIIYFGLAYVGIRLGSFVSAILGLGLIGGAALTDVFRAGFNAVQIGHREAALAAGLSPSQVYCHVLLPQTWRVTLPPLGNYTVGLVKDTSLVAAIAAPEIMFNARELVTTTFQTTFIYSAAALIYLAICLSLGRVQRALERKAAVAA